MIRTRHRADPVPGPLDGRQEAEGPKEEASHARGDLRRRGDRRLHRLLPRPAAGRGDRRRAHRRRLRRLGQVGRLPGAGLVRWLRRSAGSPGAASTCTPSWPPSSTARRWGYRRLDTWSVLAGARRESWRRSCRVRARLARRARAGAGQARHTGDHGAGAPGAVHRGDAAGGHRHGRTAAAGMRDRCRPRRRAHHRIGRQGRRRGARGRCHRHRHGAVVHDGLPMAAVAGGVRAQGQQRGVPERQQGLGRRAVRRADDRRRHGAYAGGVPARGRHDLRLRSVQPAGLAGRPCRCGAGPRGAGGAAGDDPRLRAGPRRHPDPGDPGLLPAGDAGRPAAARPGAGLAKAFVATGHSVWGILERAGQRRGDGGADRGGGDDAGGPAPVRSGAPARRDEHRNLPAPPASVLVHSCRTEMDAIEVLDAGTRKRNPVPCTGQGRNSGCAVHIAAAPSAAQCC